MLHKEANALFIVSASPELSTLVLCTVQAGTDPDLTTLLVTDNQTETQTIPNPGSWRS